jgi:putative membrane protein (TIGR04086 family)
MHKLAIRAILIGSLLDILVSFVLGVFLGISIASGIHQHSLAPAASQAAIHTAIHDARWVYLAFGLMSSMLGGYIAAKIAKHDELLNGACSSVFCVALGIFTMVRGSSIYPLWVQFLLFFLNIACGVLGGYLWLVQQKKWGRQPARSR